MKTTRLAKLIIAVSLVIAAFVVYQVVLSTTRVTANSGALPSNGFGDFRRYEAQQSQAPHSNALPSNGIGDLRRFEMQQSVEATNSASLSIHVADLLRYEAQQATQMAAQTPAP